MPLTPLDHDSGVFEHLETLGSLTLPLVGLIISLIIYAWRKMEKSVDKIEAALSKHINNDEEIHDRLFTDQRATDSKLDRLIGEHNATHKGDR